MQEPVQHFAALFVAVVGMLFFLQWARTFLVPLAIGAVLAIVLHPLVALQRRRHVPRALAAGFVVVGLWLAGGLLTSAMQSSVTNMAARAPAAVERLAQSAEAMRADVGGVLDKFRRMTAAVEHVLDGAQHTSASVRPKPAKAVDLSSALPASGDPTFILSKFVWTGSASVFAFFVQLVVVSFLVYFLLVSGHALKGKVILMSSSTIGERKRVARMLVLINTQIQASLLVVFSTNVTLGVLIGITFALLGVDDAAAWGVAATVLHFVPYLGSVALVLASSVGAFLQFDSWSTALMVAGAALLIATLVGTILTTWLQSRAAQLDPCVVYIGLLLWGWLWGIWGLLLSTALTAMVKVVCDHVQPLHPIGTLLGSGGRSKGKGARYPRVTL